jgi:hypothetical protein
MIFLDFRSMIEESKQRTKEEIRDLQKITGSYPRHQGQHDCERMFSWSVHGLVLDESASSVSESSVYSLEYPV